MVDLDLVDLADHFGSSLGTITWFDEVEKGTLNDPVEPIAYLPDPHTTSEMISRVVLPLPWHRSVDEEVIPDPSLPGETVLHLRHHAPRATARAYRYRIESYSIANLGSHVLNVALEGNWYEVDD